jgi:pyrophosphatase PpaX
LKETSSRTRDYKLYPVNKHSLFLFDLDGTLTETHQLIFDSFNHVLMKYKSVRMTPAQILSYFGPPEEVCIRNMMGGIEFESVWKDFLDYYRSHLGDSIVFQGIRLLLEELKSRGKLIGVFTAKGTSTAELTLEFHGLRSLFDIVVTGSVVKNHKPDPEGIRIALDRLGVRPEDTIVVGDSPSDCKAAASAGTDFIAVLYDNISRNRFSNLECRKAGSVSELSAILLGREN